MKGGKVDFHSCSTRRTLHEDAKAFAYIRSIRFYIDNVVKKIRIMRNANTAYGWIIDN